MSVDTRPYIYDVQPKPATITARQVLADEARLRAHVDPVARPTSGPRCCHSDCKKHLYQYEIKFGECLSHIIERNREWREEAARVRMTDTAMREQNRQGYQRRKKS